MSTPESDEEAHKRDVDNLFKLTLGKKWDKVVEMYKKYEWAPMEKLGKSEDTPLHVAISSYISGRPRESLKLADVIEKMIHSIDEPELSVVLSMQNLKKDTVLHLAAARGWERICYLIATKDSDKRLISIRNDQGETPLFLTTHHGKSDAFLCLHELYKNNNGQQPDDSLCRRKDGNTILHSAISREYFELGYQIMFYYPKLIDSVNVNGETPLHILARKPNVFPSSTNPGLCDFLIYNVARPDELKVMTYKHTDTVAINQQKTDCYPKSDQYPSNYKTCIDVFDIFFKCFSRFEKKNSSREEERNRSTRTPPSDEENQEGGEDTSPRSNLYGFFPPNYKNFILLLEFARKVILTVLGFGYNWRIKSIQEKKKQHSHSLQIAFRLIETYETGYKYDSNGLQPIQKWKPPFSKGIDIPTDAPPADEQDKSKDQKEKTETKVTKRDTAFLEAAKWGTPEIVDIILKKCPIAIQDLDSTGKNVLHVAAQNKQFSIIECLSQQKTVTETLFHQVDNDGNSILHLAAKRGEFHRPWLPGDALPMQAEIKWFKYVQSKVPPTFITHPNNEGDIPRKIFSKSHEPLVKDAAKWLIKTSESCSVIAALVASVAFGTSTTVPGGLDQQTGYPILQNTQAFDIFSITSLVALCLAVTSLVCFLAIMTSRCKESDLDKDLPTKLLVGLTALFGSIVVMMISFCAGHTVIFKEKLRGGAAPIYAIASIPIMFFAAAQLPLYYDLLFAIRFKVPYAN